MFQNKPFVGGFFNANQPPQFLAIDPVLENFPDQASVSLLQTLKVAYVVVDSSKYQRLHFGRPGDPIPGSAAY